MTKNINSGTLDGFDYSISVGSDAVHLDLSERSGVVGSPERKIGLGISQRHTWVFKNIAELQVFTNILYRQVKVLTAMKLLAATKNKKPLNVSKK